MRTLITTIGSDGDVRPFFALAKEMQSRGHDVLFAASDRYALDAAEHGIRFRSIGPPWVQEEMESICARVLALSDPLRQLTTVMEAIAEPQRQAVPELVELMSGVDVVIYPPILVAAAAVSRARKVPHVSVQFAPVHRARRYSPNGADLGPLNRLLWALAASMLRRATDPKLNAIVRAAGLAPWRNVLFEACSSRLDLIAVSPHVVGRDPEWPAASRMTGYFFYDPPGFAPEPELASFVEGEPPVVVGFGSMVGFDREAKTRVILEAVRDLPRRVVVQAGWARLAPAADMPAHVRFVNFVPHGWLLARSACAVHHGGAGTTAAVLRAGIPQAIVWHLADQPIWAKRVRRLGVSPGFTPHHKLTAAWLRSSIDRMLADGAMKDAARALGEKVRAEQGVANAADLIEQAFASA